MPRPAPGITGLFSLSPEPGGKRGSQGGPASAVSRDRPGGSRRCDRNHCVSAGFGSAPRAARGKPPRRIVLLPSTCGKRTGVATKCYADGSWWADPSHHRVNGPTPGPSPAARSCGGADRPSILLVQHSSQPRSRSLWGNASSQRLGSAVGESPLRKPTRATCGRRSGATGAAARRARKGRQSVDRTAAVIGSPHLLARARTAGS